MLADVLSDAIRRAALFPTLDLPPPPPEHPASRVARDGYTLSLFPGRSSAMVAVERLDDIDAAVADVRQVLAADGKRRGVWFVAEAAAPSGLAHALLARGFTAADEQSFEPRYAAMALVTEPAPAPGGVEARRPRTFEEFQAGRSLGYRVTGQSDEDIAAMTAQQRAQWELEQTHGGFHSFVALVDGDICGGAASQYGANAVFLAGGYTRENMRGRGVYRALVRARWDAAVEQGTPALTVGAGRMSRPILERLGFETVGFIDCLVDDFG
ncbi:MAG TPA: GNAT family N-acetyltransferase [Gaiellaceae bacterium]|nr:GNAT family N-acetyltransferase [Gaiellaceae bacterium]